MIVCIFVIILGKVIAVVIVNLISQVRLTGDFIVLLLHVIAGFDINFLTNLSIRASAILILLARNCKLLARILKCHICM